MVIDLSLRCTTDPTLFEVSALSPQSLVLILPDTTGIDTETSLEIKIGKYYFDQKTGARHPIERELLLAHGEFVVFESDQIIKLPRNIFGIICGKGNSMFRGLMVASGKIDPSFHGHLRIYVFNAGGETVRISPGDVVASAIFLSIEGIYRGIEVGEALPAIPKLPSLRARLALRLRKIPRWIWVAIGGLITGAILALRWLLK